MKFTDRAPIGAVKRTKEGYLVATARVARTGVQHYLASELGDVAIKAGFKPDDIVRVNRPESEVFSSDSLSTITRLPVTVDHPAEEVTADNWSSLAVGDVGDAYTKDGEWVVVNPMLKDSRGIDAANSTHKEISMGYRAEIVASNDKSIADFDQRNIRYNHLALVERGRAGSDARIGDSWGATPVDDKGFIEPQPGGKPITQSSKGGHNMSDALKTVVLGDKAVKVPAEDVAAIEQFKTDSAKALADAESKHEKTLADKDAELAKLQAKLDDAESKILSDADIDKRVSDRADLVSLAKSIAPNIKTQGVSDADIRKAVVTTKLGDAVIEGKSEAYIDARFDILADEAKQSNPVNDAFKSTAQGEPLNDSYNGYLARLTRKQEA